LVNDLDAEFFADRVLPPDGQGWRCLAYETPFKRRDGKYAWEHVAFPDNAAFARASLSYPGGAACRQLYFTPTTLKETTGEFLCRVPKIHRQAFNYHSSRDIPVDVDSGKPDGFPTTQEGTDAVLSVLHAIGLHPTLAVFSSASMDRSAPVLHSGLHLHLVTSTCMTRAEREPMARDLNDILDHNGIHFDRAVTTNPVGLVRPPGSINRKMVEPRQARLDLTLIDGPVYDVAELAARLAAHRPPGRMHNNSPDSISTSADLSETESAVRFLIEAGFYGGGQYVRWSYLFFALGLAVHENPELHEPIRAFFIRMTEEAGRNVALADHRLSEAIRRAGSGLERKVTVRSVFAEALKLGWKPSITEEQEHAIAVGKATLSSIFDLALSRSEAIARAARLINGTVDHLVRRRLGYSCAQSMLLRSYPNDIVLSALSAATRAPITRIPDFLLKARHG
jgi:hypothetical protein